MNPREFFDTFGADEVRRVCKRAGTTVDYFRQVMYGNRKFGHDLARRIADASENRMTKHTLCPDIYGADPAERAA